MRLRYGRTIHNINIYFCECGDSIFLFSFGYNKGNIYKLKNSILLIMKPLKYTKHSNRMITINILLLIIFLIWISLIFYNSYHKDNKLDQQLGNEYKTLKTENKINNTVVNSYFPKEWRGREFFQYITFDNGEKYSIYVRKNLNNNNVYFGQITKPGVKILKRAGSDTIIVKLIKGDEYRFLISDEP